MSIPQTRLSGEVASYRIQIYDTDEKIYKFDIKAVDHPQSVNIRKNTTLNDRGDLIREGFGMIARALDWRK